MLGDNVRLGYSDEAFIAAFPEAYKKLKALVEAIRTALGKTRRRSKNGSSAERNMNVE